LTLASVVVSPNFQIAANSCGATLAVAAACTLQMAFAPTAAGPLNGTLTLTDNASTATQTVLLSGLGIDFSLASAGSTMATLSSGASAAYPLLLSSAAGVTGSVAFTCTGQPTNSTCTVAPAAPVLGGNTSVTVTVQTGVLAEVDPRGVAPWRVSGVVLALGLPVLLMFRRRRFVWVMLVLMVMSGCGSERQIPSSGGGIGGGGGGSSYPTPGGTYNLIVTGTSAGLARSVPLVLVVQ